MYVLANHRLDETILTKVLGWKWISFIGTPTRGTEGYPNKCRVRQLLSPKQLESEEWRAELAKREARDADGSEPLSYAYCSSQGPARPPRIFLLIDEETA